MQTALFDALEQQDSADNGAADCDAHTAKPMIVHVTGTPGCGKTSLIEATLRHFGPTRRIGVLIGNPAADRDAKKLLPHARLVMPVKMWVLQPSDVAQALNRANEVGGLDLLLMESAGPVVLRGDGKLGEDARVAMFSVAAGDDKPVEYPQLLTGASLVILNKMDLLKSGCFDLRSFQSDVENIDPSARVVYLSSRTGEGMNEWTQWLATQLAAKHSGTCQRDPMRPEWYFG